MAHKAGKKTVYIVKPDHGCQGKGIFLARGPKQILKIQKKQKLDPLMVVQ
jgi:predicted ATP-grasp superfamily ATP-dependent carboligase